MGANRGIGRRLLWPAFLSLVWLAIVALLLEFWAIGMPLLREARNPYVLALTRGEPWPRTDAESALVNQVPPARKELLREPAQEEQLAAQVIYMLSQDDASRTAYAEVYRRHLSLAVNGGPVSEYGDPVDQPQETRQSWYSQVAALAPFELPGAPWKDWSCRANTLDPDGIGPVEFATTLQLTSKSTGQSAQAIVCQLPYEVPPADSPYRYPFLDFKLHGEAPEGKVFFGFPEFRLNNYGFRDDDVEVPRPAGVFRVACVGASTTMEGANNGFTYPNLVERFLREQFPGKAIEVINCGVSGLESRGERARFADYVMLDPNVIVYYNAINQLCYADMRRWLKESPAWLTQLRKSRFAVTTFGRWLDPDEKTMRQSFESRGQADILALAAFAQSCGITPVLTTFCHPDGATLTAEERVYYERDARLNWTGRALTLDTYLRAIGLWNEMLRDAGKQHGVACIDVAAQLSGGGRVFGDLCHMKDYGIEQKARIIAAGLEPYVTAFFQK